MEVSIKQYMGVSRGPQCNLFCSYAPSPGGFAKKTSFEFVVDSPSM